jgi:hypothetical protein
MDRGTRPGSILPEDRELGRLPISQKVARSIVDAPPPTLLLASRARRDQTDQRRRRLPDPDQHRVYQFGWDGSAFWHLSEEGGPIPDWAGHERVDFTPRQRGRGIPVGSRPVTIPQELTGFHPCTQRAVSWVAVGEGLRSERDSDTMCPVMNRQRRWLTQSGLCSTGGPS